MSFDFNSYRRKVYANTPITAKIAKRERDAIKLLSRLGYVVTPPTEEERTLCLSAYLDGVRR